MKFTYMTGLKLFIALQVVVYILVSDSLFQPSHIFASPVDANWALNRESAVERPWTIITHSFMHAGIIHLAFNMLALAVLGRLGVAEEFRGKVILAYTLGIFASAAFVLAVPTKDNIPTVGASGAIFAIIGLMAVYFEFKDFKKEIWKIVIFNALFSLIPGISWQAHLGGFLAGVLIAIAYNYSYARDDDKAIAENNFADLVLPAKTFKTKLGILLGLKKAWQTHDKQGLAMIDFLEDTYQSGRPLIRILPTGERIVVQSTKIKEVLDGAN